ncbi:MAG TPA: acetate kinase [Smithellaceae bacterium]|nr:acetate kinase [Smithella sp.]HNZ10348.1 acetate kinase [Smithellaceae bacterium]HOG80782.1 acetate kinase [Smithellaceae bacterium]HPL66154.1 acetate kinase [Smithellaceae bacterium]
MKILVLNCGSSSLKYKLCEMETSEVLAQGQADRIGLPDALFQHDVQGRETFLDKTPLSSHHDAVHALLTHLVDGRQGILTDMKEIGGVGHRVVHGGEHFRTSVVVDPAIRKILESTKKIAPLHNPPNLMGIDVCTNLMPGVPQVAVFDTAFHQSMPAHAFTYAIPYRYYTEDHIRRYGFHGTSHRYVARRTAALLQDKTATPRIITCHLGAGSSLCAVAGGKSLDTSMGFTPLSGLVMGTRSGDIDPAVVSFIMEKENASMAGVMDILNRQSGVLGISGVSPDFRDLEKAAEEGHERAHLALTVFAYSVARGIGSLIPSINGLDALAFTAGIGEHSPHMRQRICSFLSWLGIILDEDKNDKGDNERMISKQESKINVFVIPTDEEKMIAEESWAVLRK